MIIDPWSSLNLTSKRVRVVSLPMLALLPSPLNIALSFGRPFPSRFCFFVTLFTALLQFSIFCSVAAVFGVLNFWDLGFLGHFQFVNFNFWELGTHGEERIWVLLFCFYCLLVILFPDEYEKRTYFYLSLCVCIFLMSGKVAMLMGFFRSKA